jgi:hypothetical protein
MLRTWTANARFPSSACGLLLVSAVTSCGSTVIDATGQESAAGSSHDNGGGGSGQGPDQLPDAACPPVEGEATEDIPWDVALGTLIKRGDCANGACHGHEPVAAVALYLPAGDPAAFYDGLTTFEGTHGRPYVDAVDSRESWIHCHLPAHAPTSFTEADLEVIQNWLRLGAPAPE